jgi:hypothetical protein
LNNNSSKTFRFLPFFFVVGGNSLNPEWGFCD